MNSNTMPLVIVVIVSMMLVAYSPDIETLPLDSTTIIAEAISLLTSLLVISLMLERSAATYNALIFTKIEAEIEQAKQEAVSFIKNISKQSIPSESRVAEVSNNLEQAAKNEKEIDLDKNWKSLMIPLSIAALLTLGGIRSIENLFDFPSGAGDLVHFQEWVMKLADMILTTGLLAGGSQGIKKIIDALPTNKKEDQDIAKVQAQLRSTINDARSGI